MKLPNSAPDLTPGLIAAFEKAAGQKVEDIAVSTRDRIKFTYKKVEFDDVPAEFFSRVGRAVFEAPKQGATARQYVQLIRDGTAHDVARRLIQSVAESKPEQLPALESLTRELIVAFEAAVGTKIEEWDARDNTRISFEFEGAKYEDFVRGFLSRVSKQLTASKDQHAVAKKYLCSIRDGKKATEATTLATKDFETAKGVNALPKPPSLEAKHIQAFEKAVGKKLEDCPTGLQQKFTFKIGKESFEESPNALFERIATALFKNRSERAKARAYACLMRDGNDHDAAMVKLNESADKTPESLPNPPLLTSDHILAFEAACGNQIENLPTSDTQERLFKYGDKAYSENPCSLYSRIGKIITGDKNARGKGKQYLCHVRDGLDHEAAVNAVESAVKLVSLPNPPELTKAHINALERHLGKSIGEVDTDSEKTVFTLKIGKITFTDSPHRIFCRVGNAVFGSAGQRVKARSYMVQIAAGKSHDNAFTHVQEAIASQGQPLPNPPIPFVVLQAFRTALDIDISRMNTNDETRYKFSDAGQNYEDSPRQICRRVSIALFGDHSSLGKARDYLHFSAEGHGHEEALRMANHKDDSLVDGEFEKLGRLEVEDAVALLGGDPAKLKLYLQYAHPELSEAEVDQLVRRSFKGLVTGPNRTKEEQYLGWEARLPEVQIETEIPETTEENTLTVKGKAPNAECVYVAGTWNRRKRVEPDGSFTVVIPLKVGEENEIRIIGLDRERKVRTEQTSWTVRHEGQPDDLAALFALLSQLRGDLLRGIQEDPGRTEFFVSCAEKLLIKKFARSFPEGEEYMRVLIEQTTSKIVRRVLDGVLKNFRTIEKMKLPNVKDGSLMFFQKYCVYEIRKKMRSGARGVNLANDPGLGKTRTILAALSDEEAAIFTPNAVVSAWDEEAIAALIEPDLLVLRDVPHQKRKELLRGAAHLRMVTNIQFLQSPDDAERFDLLSSDNTVVVHDEAHSRANEQSQQSRGAKKLRHKFQINVTATLANNPKTLRRMLHTLEPNDERFKDDKVFAEAFPSSDTQALKTLKLLVDKYTIRFRKEDVMEEVDPDVLLSQQLHRLPRKNVISPEQLGEFEMSDQQAWAIYKMFLNWQEWTEEYGHYMPDDEIAEEDRLRVSGGGLVKKHALRQTVNNPAYIGSRAEDAKAKQTRRIVEKCLREGRKVVIFCAYTAQALKYAEMFKKHKPALYTGLTSKEGEKKGAGDVPKKFRREPGVHGFKGTWVFDSNGYPVEDPSGETMSAMDYERLTFQNAADRKLIICTEKAGAVGTTFTAGKALIDDDLSDSVVMDIQKKDRIHRIDPQRLTHPTADYYTLRSKYSQRFLDEMRRRWVVKQDDGTYLEYKSLAAARRDPCITEEKPPTTAYEAFFAQGTYDQVQEHNLEVQRQMFRLINDGIADESILTESQMPFAGLDNGNGH